jgi:predicted PhzF superfamily epimerase YddE/YHI9
MMNFMPSALFHVDAFAAKPFEGNPAAVCPLDGWLDDDRLRQVAAENNLSETAFFVASDNHHGHYELRWFTPRCEVKLCGHATLASGFVVLNILEPERNSVRFETRHSGALTVSRDGDLLSMDFPAIPPRDCPNPPEKLFRALGTAPVPLTVIEGNSKYLAVYESEQVVRDFRPDFAFCPELRRAGRSRNRLGALHADAVLFCPARQNAAARAPSLRARRRTVVRNARRTCRAERESGAHLARRAVDLTARLNAMLKYAREN